MWTNLLNTSWGLNYCSKNNQRHWLKTIRHRLCTRLIHKENRKTIPSQGCKIHDILMKKFFQYSYIYIYIYTQTHIYIRLYVYIYIYMCVCVCVCVCVCMCVWLRLCVCVSLSLSIYIYIYIRWSLNKFPDFFRMDTFIDSTHVKL